MTSRKPWTPQEIQFLIDNYYKGVKFVQIKLSNRTKHSIITKAKRLSISKVNKSNYDFSEIDSLVKESFSFAEVFRKLNKSKSGNGYAYLRRFILKNNIDISHFQPWKNNGSFKEKKDIQEYLINGSNITSSHLKAKLYESDLKQRICEKCGQSEYWRGEKISLILDHINGISNDNRLENLRILCPNCNATLPTHCRGSKGLKEKHNEIKKDIFTISQKNSQLNQRKAIRPPYNQLLQEISELGYVSTGKKYGVSDNTIRKWIKMYKKHGDKF